MKRQLKVFKVPTHHPVYDINHDVLNQVVETYDPARAPAPHTPGHRPNPGDPAFAWISELAVDGDFLVLSFDASNLTRAGFDALQSGNFKTVSPAFYAPKDPYNPTPGKWHLKHLAWLGAESPAGKDIDLLDASLLDGFKPPQTWNISAALAFHADEIPGKSFVVFSEIPPDMDSLKVAVIGTAWNPDEAKQRVKDMFGEEGLSYYSLHNDWSKAYETFERYQALVVDIVSNEPMIIPAAVDAAIKAIPSLYAADKYDEEARKAALSRAQALKDKISAEQKHIGFADDNPGGSPVKDKKKLIALLQDKAKGKIADDKLVAFSGELADILFNRFKTAEFSEEEVMVYANDLVEARIALFTEKVKSAGLEADAKKKDAEFAARERQAAVTTQVDALLSEGRIPAARKEKVVAFAQGLSEGTVTFTENDQQTEQPSLDAFFSIIRDVVKQGTYAPPPGELDTGGKPAEFTEEDKTADEIAATVNTKE